jgi:hypothetical protein
MGEHEIKKKFPKYPSLNSLCPPREINTKLTILKVELTSTPCHSKRITGSSTNKLLIYLELDISMNLTLGFVTNFKQACIFLADKHLCASTIDTTMYGRSIALEKKFYLYQSSSPR